MLLESHIGGDQYPDNSHSSDDTPVLPRPTLADQSVRASAAAGAASIDPVLAARELSIEAMSKQTGIPPEDVRMIIVAIVAQGIEQNIVDAALAFLASRRLAETGQEVHQQIALVTADAGQPVQPKEQTAPAAPSLVKRVQQYLSELSIFSMRRVVS